MLLLEAQLRLQFARHCITCPNEVVTTFSVSCICLDLELEGAHVLLLRQLPNVYVLDSQSVPIEHFFLDYVLDFLGQLAALAECERPRS